MDFSWTKEQRELRDAAKAFAGSARLKEVMEAAGVVGAPDIWFANQV